MSELENMTLGQAVRLLRECVEKNRNIEETARRDRERDEAALAALEPLLGGHTPDASTPANDGAKRPPFLGLAAVREVMRESPTRIWTPREIHEVLEQRGWLSGKAEHPKAGTEAAINRLVAKGEIKKIGRGQYSWRVRQEALTET